MVIDPFEIRNKEILDEYDYFIGQQMKPKDIYVLMSKVYNLSPETIRHIVYKQRKNLNLIMPKHNAESDKRDAAIFEKSKEGMPIREIAKEFNVSDTWVKKVFKSRGITNYVDKFKMKKKEELMLRAKRITDDYNAGMTLPQLCKKYNVPGSVVHDILRPLLEVKYDKIYSDYCSGVSIAEICDRYNYKKHIVSRIIHTKKRRKENDVKRLYYI